MIFFPQVEQYPVRRRGIWRTVVNRTADGREVKLEDPGWSRVEWTVAGADLAQSEWDAVAGVFGEVEGGLGTFTFLDPFDNLLEQSEAFEASVWTRDPFLALAGGVPDPLGGAGATEVTNSGVAAQRISQPIDGHGSFQYCFSVWARSTAPAIVQLIRSADGDFAATSITTASNWRRYSSSGRLSSSGESVTAGIELPPGSIVEIFGAQLETQLVPSGYKKTLSQAGVYTKARFAEDRAVATATGLAQFATTLRITARP